MNPLRRILPLFMTVAILTNSPAAFANPPLLPAFPPAEFHPPKPERVVLPNGIVLFLLEDHELPLIKVALTVKAGSQYDPPDRVGSSNVFGPAMTEGGSQGHTPEDILRALDVSGASIDFSVGLDEASGSMESRAEDFDTIFGLFIDLLVHPQFRNDHVDLEKSKQLEALRRMNDDPEEISRREFRFAVYGKSHPYARIPDPASIDNIRRKDLLDMHQHYFKPNATWMAVSGDFQSAAMKQKITTALAAWARADVVYPAIPPVVPTAQPKLLYVEREINQSQIRIGHTGFARHNPDYFAWEVFNELWGNGGVSRLFRIVRTEKGLAYDVGSTFSEYNDLGLIVAISQTRGPQTVAAIQAMQEIANSLVNAPFTEQEIHYAKESIRNRFIDNFTSSAQIVSQVMTLEYRGYPADYLDTYTDRIAAIQQSDLQRVGQKYLQPDKNVTLVVGDLSTFEKPLSTLGRPLEVKITDYNQDPEYAPAQNSR